METNEVPNKEQLATFSDALSKEFAASISNNLKTVSQDQEGLKVQMEYIDTTIYAVAMTLVGLISARAVLAGEQLYEASAYLNRTTRLCNMALEDIYDQALTTDANTLFGNLGGSNDSSVRPS